MKGKSKLLLYEQLNSSTFVFSAQQITVTIFSLLVQFRLRMNACLNVYRGFHKTSNINRAHDQYSRLYNITIKYNLRLHKNL